MSNDWSTLWTARPFHKKICLVAATLLCLFHIYTALFGVFDALMQRSVHLGLGLILVFLLSNKGGQAKPSPWEMDTRAHGPHRDRLSPLFLRVRG